MSDTNAIKWLTAQGVNFRVMEYAFTVVGADHAAEATGVPLEACCKTLVVQGPSRQYWIAIVPGDQRFDTRKMAAAVGVREAELADHELAEKLTGYQIGGISPFATRRPFSAVIEESLLALEKIVVNGGRRGTLVELSPDDVVRLLNATPADICG